MPCWHGLYSGDLLHVKEQNLCRKEFFNDGKDEKNLYLSNLPKSDLFSILI